MYELLTIHVPSVHSSTIELEKDFKHCVIISCILLTVFCCLQCFQCPNKKTKNHMKRPST